MLRSSSASFDRVLEKATSQQLLEPDWAANLAICDMIRQGDVQAKYAVLAVKKKLYHQNPHVAVYALHLLEAMVKNCGAPVHDEVGQLPFMQEMRELIVQAPDLVKEKLLELLQTWAFAFRQSPRYRAVQDTVNVMRAEGFKFPALRESDAMFAAETAPEWADGEACHRCRDGFSTFTRKHHCRACGQVFCGKCSSKTSNIPKFGIEREVRVCDSCYDQINKPTSGGTGKPAAPAGKTDADLPPEYLASPLSKQSQAPPPRKSEQELKEEEELALALAISQSEAEAKEREKQRGGAGRAASGSSAAPTGLKSAMKRSDSPPERDPESDPELARYLNRSYWESRQDQLPQSPTAPANGAPATSGADDPAVQVSQSQPTPVFTASEPLQQNGASDQQLDQFVATICSQLEIFVNRMKSNSSRGRPISNDSSVQTLFMNITAMHSQLLHNIQLQDDQRVHYESLQDQLAQVRDARAALDALREEHRERLRQEAEEAQRQRQMQMMQKLEIMRKKKQEYLQYQRQLAIQRMQEQEREMARRHEQQAAQPAYPPWQQPYPAVWQPAAAGYPPAAAPGSYPPPSSEPYPPAGPGYPSGPYQPYNMHQMSAALPPGGEYGPPQHGYQPDPSQPQGPPGHQQGPQGLPGHQQGPQGPPGHQQGPPGQQQGPQGPPGYQQGPPGQQQGPQGPPGNQQGPPGHQQGPQALLGHQQGPQAPLGHQQGLHGGHDYQPGPPGQHQGLLHHGPPGPPGPGQGHMAGQPLPGAPGALPTDAAASPPPPQPDAPSLISFD